MTIGTCLSKPSSLIFLKLNQHSKNLWKTTLYFPLQLRTVSSRQGNFPNTKRECSGNHLASRFTLWNGSFAKEPSDHCLGSPFNFTEHRIHLDLGWLVVHGHPPTSQNLRPGSNEHGRIEMEVKSSFNPAASWFRVSKVVSFIWQSAMPQGILTLMDSKSSKSLRFRQHKSEKKTILKTCNFIWWCTDVQYPKTCNYLNWKGIPSKIHAENRGPRLSTSHAAGQIHRSQKACMYLNSTSFKKNMRLYVKFGRWFLFGYLRFHKNKKDMGN